MVEDEVTLREEDEAPTVYVRGAVVTVGLAVAIVLGYLACFLHSTALFR